MSEYVKERTGLQFSFLFLNGLSEFISHVYNGLGDISEMSKILLGNDETEVFLSCRFYFMTTICNLY